MLKLQKLYVFAATFLLSATALATNCPSHYVDGRPPIIERKSLLAQTQEICFKAYGVMFSGVSRTPLWSAEHLTRAQVTDARELSRINSFHTESTLPSDMRSELSDFVRSGFDRGHMSPNGDMADRDAQYESFSLANIVPQVHSQNAGIWADIEGVARKLAVNDGEVYLLTGPAFIIDPVQQLKGRVLVPSHIWKVIYDPGRKEAAAYWSANDTSGTYSVISVTELEKLVGLELLPGVSQKVRNKKMDLPIPIKSSHGYSNRISDTHEPHHKPHFFSSFLKSL